MDAINQDKFNEQMLFLKTANFGNYLHKWQWFCITLPLLSLLINFDSDLIVVNFLRMLLIEIVALWTIYSMYLFFKPLASTDTMIFSKLKLFLVYFINTALLWFLLNVDLDLNRHLFRHILIDLGIAIAFSLLLSGIMAACMNENIKTFIQNKTT